MKKNLKTNVLGVITLIVAVFFFFACDPVIEPGPDPDDPTPTELVKPVVTIGVAENVTDTTAILVGWVKPNEKDTKVYFEYKISTESSFHQKPVSGSYADTVSIKINLDLSDLTPNAEYSFKITAVNAAGKASSEESKFSTYVVRDYDGNWYHVIKIGEQYWLQESLKTAHYADGTAIANVTDGDTWAGLSTGAYCYYNNDAALGKIYGALYNWYTVETGKSFITGYHVPAPSEFTALVDYLGGDLVSGPKMMDASGKYWDFSISINPNPTNSSGFTSLPAGGRGANINGASFSRLRTNNMLLTSYGIGGYSNIFEVEDGSISGFDYKCGVGVRLIKD